MTWSHQLQHHVDALVHTAAATDAAVGHRQTLQSLADLHAPEVSYEMKKAPAKKRGAVIGAAPKLNSEGLLAASRAAQDKQKALVSHMLHTFFESVHGFKACPGDIAFWRVAELWCLDSTCIAARNPRQSPTV
jgi:hypothetical protein